MGHLHPTSPPYGDPCPHPGHIAMGRLNFASLPSVQQRQHRQDQNSCSKKKHPTATDRTSKESQKLQKIATHRSYNQQSKQIKEGRFATFSPGLSSRMFADRVEHPAHGIGRNLPQKQPLQYMPHKSLCVISSTCLLMYSI